MPGDISGAQEGKATSFLDKGHTLTFLLLEHNAVCPAGTSLRDAKGQVLALP